MKPSSHIGTEGGITQFHKCHKRQKTKKKKNKKANVPPRAVAPRRGRESTIGGSTHESRERDLQPRSSPGTVAARPPRTPRPPCRTPLKNITLSLIFGGGGWGNWRDHKICHSCCTSTYRNMMPISSYPRPTVRNTPCYISIRHPQYKDALSMSIQPRQSGIIRHMGEEYST